MKNLYILLLFSLFATSARAQTPVAFNYQAIARDMNDQPYRGEEMEVGISITDADGNEVYGEEHNVRTNSLGIFNIMVGKGDKTSNNSLDVVDWSTGGPFMLEVSVTVGGSIRNLAPSPLVFVPLSLYTLKAGSLESDFGGDVNGKFTDLQLNPAVVGSPELADASVINTKIANGAVDNAKLLDNAVTTEKIADAQVKTADIDNDAVTEPKISAGAVTTTKIANGAVDNAKLLDNAVTTEKIADAQVKTGDIADDAVTEPKISAGAVTTNKIADAQVTSAKLASMGAANGQVLKWNNGAWTPQADNDGASTQAGGDLSGPLTNLQLQTGSVGTTEVLDGSLTNADISDGSIISEDITDGSLTGADIQDNSIASWDILDNTITSGDVNDGSLTGADIQANSIPGGDITDNTIASWDIIDNTITSEDVTDGGLTGVDIQDNTIASWDILDNTITSGDVNDGSLTGTDISDYSIGGGDLNPTLNVTASGLTVNGGPLVLNSSAAEVFDVSTDNATWIGVYTNSSITHLHQFGIPAANTTVASTMGSLYGSSLIPLPALPVQYSLKAANSIIAPTFYATSDRRIKKDIVGLDIQDIGRAFGQLRVVNYGFQDIVQKGNTRQTGFIAQEVEQVFPEAVTRTSDFVPDIYQLAQNIQYQAATRTLHFSLENPPAELQKGDKLRVIADKAYEVLVSDIQGNTVSIQNWPAGNTQNAFVYGRFVDDFRVVDYDRIFTLNVAATQSLLQQVNTLQGQVDALLSQQAVLLENFRQLSAQVQQLRTDTQQLTGKQ